MAAADPGRSGWLVAAKISLSIPASARVDTRRRPTTVMRLRTLILRIAVISCAVLSIACSMQTANAAEIRVYPDRDQLSINDAFVLTFESAGDVDKDPDF